MKTTSLRLDELLAYNVAYDRISGVNVAERTLCADAPLSSPCKCSDCLELDHNKSDSNSVSSDEIEPDSIVEDD